MIDNLEPIKTLLNFENKGDFYMLYILKRRKDQPEGDKIEMMLSTKNGFHLITKRFDVIKFKEKYPDIDIQRKNPILLYFPDSLDN